MNTLTITCTDCGEEIVTNENFLDGQDNPVCEDCWLTKYATEKELKGYAAFRAFEDLGESLSGIWGNNR